MIQPVSGFINVVVLEVTDILKHERGLEELMPTLEAMEDDNLIESAPKFGVGRGQALYIPFGFIPIIVASGAPKEEKAHHHMEDFSVTMLHWNMSGPPFTFPQIPKAEVCAGIKSVVTRKMKSLMPSREALRSWIASWDPMPDAVSSSPRGADSSQGTSAANAQEPS